MKSTAIRRQRCFLCNGNDEGYAYTVRLCGECLSGVDAKDKEFIVVSGPISPLQKDFCEMHGKYRINVSAVNVFLCSDCHDKTARIESRYYQKEKAKYLNSIAPYIEGVV